MDKHSAVVKSPSLSHSLLTVKCFISESQNALTHVHGAQAGPVHILRSTAIPRPSAQQHTLPRTIWDLSDDHSMSLGCIRKTTACRMQHLRCANALRMPKHGLLGGEREYQADAIARRLCDEPVHPMAACSADSTTVGIRLSNLHTCPPLSSARSRGAKTVFMLAHEGELRGY